jgi:hypothetical protein
MTRRNIPMETCPGCGGKGSVCCRTWAMVRASADEDLQFSGVGLPLWPLLSNLEMAYCPFCGNPFGALRVRKPRARSN